MVSTPPPPNPPCSANPCQSCTLIGCRSASILRRCSKVKFSPRKRFTLSLSIVCSSVRLKSISKPHFKNLHHGGTEKYKIWCAFLCVLCASAVKSVLESQHHLRNDIALDFVGAAVDGGLAIIEIAG